ncbi:MAG: hypothetical protein Q8L85_04330 [Alphaproteobacteria bacterium]|nr:hypothetical protein [Alphaproteobacteria bacterium]
MTLNDYLELNNISYARFSEMIGAASPMTAYRYAKGLRKPKGEVLEKIIKVTHGKVVIGNSHKNNKNQYVRNAAEKGGIKGGKGSDLWVHLNAPLEFEHKDFDENSSIHSLPVSLALQELGVRIDYRKKQFYLDGKPTRIREIIDFANKRRKERGLIEIFYPSE